MSGCTVTGAGAGVSGCTVAVGVSGCSGAVGAFSTGAVVQSRRAIVAHSWALWGSKVICIFVSGAG